jgi:hypothetical protein
VRPKRPQQGAGRIKRSITTPNQEQKWPSQRGASKPDEKTVIVRGAHNLIDPNQWDWGEVAATGNPLPGELAERIDSANARDLELQAFLGVLASEYSLTGVNGLKDRTDLMEYRHDAV